MTHIQAGWQEAKQTGVHQSIYPIYTSGRSTVTVLFAASHTLYSRICVSPSSGKETLDLLYHWQIIVNPCKCVVYCILANPYIESSWASTVILQADHVPVQTSSPISQCHLAKWERAHCFTEQAQWKKLLHVSLIYYIYGTSLQLQKLHIVSFHFGNVRDILSWILKKTAIQTNSIFSETELLARIQIILGGPRYTITVFWKHTQKLSSNATLRQLAKQVLQLKFKLLPVKSGVQSK